MSHIILTTTITPCISVLWTVSASPPVPAQTTHRPLGSLIRFDREHEEHQFYCKHDECTNPLFTARSVLRHYAQKHADEVPDQAQAKVELTRTPERTTAPLRVVEIELRTAQKNFRDDGARHPSSGPVGYFDSWQQPSGIFDMDDLDFGSSSIGQEFITPRAERPLPSPIDEPSPSAPQPSDVGFVHRSPGVYPTPAQLSSPTVTFQTSYLPIHYTPWDVVEDSVVGRDHSLADWSGVGPQDEMYSDIFTSHGVDNTVSPELGPDGIRVIPPGIVDEGLLPQHQRPLSNAWQEEDTGLPQHISFDIPDSEEEIMGERFYLSSLSERG